MIKFRKTSHIRKETTLLQDNVEQAVKQLNDEPFIGGRFISVERSNTNQFDINTGLNRSAKGWLVTETSSASTFYRIKTSRDADGILTIKPSASGNFTFWVF